MLIESGRTCLLLALLLDQLRQPLYPQAVLGKAKSQFFLRTTAFAKSNFLSINSRIRSHGSTFLLVILAFAPLRLNTSASFLTNTPLINARYWHTATILDTGKVLVTGGWNGDYLASAELYNPDTGKWDVAGQMTTNRCYHTATLLPGGKVLIAGGYGIQSPFYLSSAELYDPATDKFTPTGSMTSPHVYHTATLLPNGQVLVAGGAYGYAIAELYDPAVEKWTRTGPMNHSRWYHSATLLPNGTVLIAGGDLSYGPSAEIYDPSMEVWIDTGTMTVGRGNHTATLLPDGKVLVAGGSAPGRVHGGLLSLSSSELYDPISMTWTATTNSPKIPRANHTSTLLSNGKVLLAGGFRDGPGSIASSELYDPEIRAWVDSNENLIAVRSSHTASLLPDGNVLIAGGLGGSDVVGTTELYRSQEDISLIAAQRLGDGSFQFLFSPTNKVPLNVLATTHAESPLKPGEMRFIDPIAGTPPQRFFRVQFK